MPLEEALGKASKVLVLKWLLLGRCEMRRITMERSLLDWPLCFYS